MIRRYLANRPEEFCRIHRMFPAVVEGCIGHRPVHLLVQRAGRLGSFGFCFSGLELAWVALFE